MNCEICNKEVLNPSFWGIVIYHFKDSKSVFTISKFYCDRCIRALLKRNESLKVKLEG